MPNKEAQLARDTFLDILRAHDRLQAAFVELFRSHGLTSSQFNVLRILRGAPGHEGSCQYIGQRLVSAVPDVTRLVDRMVVAKLVLRERSDQDRRVVRIRLTPKGLELCNRLDEPVDQLHRQQFAALTQTELEGLHHGLQTLLQSQDPAGKPISKP
ncbi:MAG: MarR family transcriptional regulator [Planctomycetes bacterium]|nr:MarR family transcriptional regulator [Planctomycetota bacterium]MCB9909934.1 MarR family transcriptional regulator [Planctomycetota bacterium]MCB9912929.1 MarR family transcriptional regulator [Planctomycetota bacterium]HPF12747.1 MarR family transcriptional regulator [Planctomycetota bacterium]HRV79823.1 MarR family transcriptional regulator [Planctomycetota bacterium]